MSRTSSSLVNLIARSRAVLCRQSSSRAQMKKPHLPLSAVCIRAPLSCPPQQLPDFVFFPGDVCHISSLSVTGLVVRVHTGI